MTIATKSSCGLCSANGSRLTASSRPGWIAFASLTAVVLTGCGEYGGGATVVPNVTFVPAEVEGGSATSGDAGGTAESGAAAAGGFGSVSGRVVFQGSAPVLPPSIRAGSDIKDKDVCAATDLPNEQLILGEKSGVANVFIFLARAPKGGKPLESGTESLIFDQKNCRFLPHCMITPVGREVRVLSDDSVAHNTHTNPKKQAGISQVVNAGDRVGDSVRFAYKKSEGMPVLVTCDFHGWMAAWHLPLDHPYAALSGANGEFTIPDLPAGKHVFIVWHEAADGNILDRKLTVEVKAGETAVLEVPYPADKLKLK